MSGRNLGCLWIEERILAWEAGGRGIELCRWLGMNAGQYGRWLEKAPVYVLGIDEVGTGAVAGPMVVGGVLARCDWSLGSLRDSKAFTGVNAERERMAVSEAVRAEVRYFEVSVTSVEIDRVGIGKAWEGAVRGVYELAGIGDDVLVVLDGEKRVKGLESAVLAKADTFVPQVMAASVCAKASRDSEMNALGRKHPGYGFAGHKGYGTFQHRNAVGKLGMCEQHRRSYRFARNGGLVTGSK